MPEKVLRTYEKFLEKLEVRNTVVGGIGAHIKGQLEYRRETLSQ